METENVARRPVDGANSDPYACGSVRPPRLNTPLPLATRCFLVIALLPTAGCSLIAGHDCTTDLRFAVNVRVTDSLTGAPIASGAQLLVWDGQYSDSTSIPTGHPEVDASILKVAPERAGAYTVFVRKSGYREWTRSSVVATSTVCHVNPAEITARMQRQ